MHKQTNAADEKQTIICMWTWCLTKVSLWISAQRSQLGFGTRGYEMRDHGLEIVGNILNAIIAKQNYKIPFQLFYSINNIFSLPWGYIQTSNILGPPGPRMAYPSHKFLFPQLNFLCLILTDYPQVLAWITQGWWRDITSSPDSLLHLGLSLGREWDGAVGAYRDGLFTSSVFIPVGAGLMTLLGKPCLGWSTWKTQELPGRKPRKGEKVKDTKLIQRLSPVEKEKGILNLTERCSDGLWYLPWFVKIIPSPSCAFPLIQHHHHVSLLYWAAFFCSRKSYGTLSKLIIFLGFLIFPHLPPDHYQPEFKCR